MGKKQNKEKAYDTAKLKSDCTSAPRMATLGDFWPSPKDVEVKQGLGHLEPASNAVTILNGSGVQKPNNETAAITLKLAPIVKQTDESDWYESYCSSCIAVIYIHKDWVNPPRYCRECKDKQQARWIMRPCKRCKNDMPICLEWSTPPEWCESCRSEYPPKKVTCRRCKEKFIISSGLQIKAKELKWNLPTQCQTCRALPAPSKPSRSARSAGSYLSSNITTRYKTSRLNTRIRVVSGGAPSMGRKR